MCGPREADFAVGLGQFHFRDGLQGRLRLCEVGGGPRHRDGVQPVGMAQHLPHPHAFEGHVCVAGVLDMVLPRLAQDVAQLRAAEGEQRADHGNTQPLHHRAGANPGEPCQPAAAIEPHQQGLGLVVGVVGGGDGGDSGVSRPVAQRAVAGDARLFLPVARCHFDFQHRAGDAERLAGGRDEAAFPGGFRAQSVIDGGDGDVDVARVGEAQQRHAVGPARHGEAQPATFSPDAAQAVGEAPEQRPVDRAAGHRISCR